MIGSAPATLTPPPTASEFIAAARRRQFFYWLGGILIAALFGVLYTVSPVVPVALFLAFGVALATWHKPIIGAYVLLFAACALDGAKSGYPDQTLELVQFFRPVQEVVRGSGMILSQAELYMLLIAVVSVARALFDKRFSYKPGAYCGWMLALFAWWLFEVANGVATHGDAKLALLEVRISAYVVTGYFIAYGVLRTTGEIEKLGWPILIGSGIKGIQGCFRYYITFHHDISGFPSGQTILEHHEAFMFNCFFFYVALLFLTNGPVLQKRTALAMLPFVVIANIYNGRRAGDSAMLIGIIVLVVVFYLRYPEKRQRMGRGIAIAAVLAVVYGAVFWNSDNPLGKPVHAIKSQITPDARDKSSDEYRKVENSNLMYTIQQSWITGFGFGKEFLRPTPMLDLRKVDPYLFVLPHNSILWVCMRMGLFGFILFWLVIAKWVRHAYRTVLSSDDPIVLRWAMFAVVLVFLDIAIAYFDMGMYGPRIQLYVGLTLGVADRLSRIVAETQAKPEPAGRRRAIPRRRPAAPRTVSAKALASRD